MTAQPQPLAHHPVRQAVERSREAFDDLVETPLWSMTEADVEAVVVEAGRLRAQAEELELRAVRESERRGCAERTGAPSTAVAWAVQTRQPRPVAIVRMRLAEKLERFEATRVALAAGHLHTDQASVIVAAVDALPDDLDPALVARAEAHLLIEATRYDAKTLKLLGKRLLTVLAPEIGEARDARMLELEEAEAASAAFFTMCSDGHGSRVGKFKLPEAQAAMLHKALLAIAAPKHQTAVHGTYERTPSPERLGAAFVELVERYPTDRLPHAGGLNATVVVTMTLDSLLGGLAHANLDTGGVLTAAQARRIACEAGIIPAVLGGKSEVLDLGRRQRFFTTAQRVALHLQQPVCTVRGCDWPSYLCHAHHDHSWSHGGHTDLNKARTLCPHHHARIHDPTFATRHHPDGTVSFHRRE